ncbi:MAG: hypothetical protein WAT78_12095 [Rhizobiaceae bacterium]
MHAFVVLVFALAAGLTVAGLSGTAMEIRTGQKLMFAPPHVSADHLLRSLAFSAAAGPLMLGNEALEAWREGRIGQVVFLGLWAMGFAWAICSGVLALSFAGLVFDLF